MLVSWLCLLLVAGSSQGARILGIFPTPSISHQLPFQAVMKALASRGHHVTVISTDPLKAPQANYTDIDLSFTYDFFRQVVDPNEMGMTSVTAYDMVDISIMMSGALCNVQLPSQPMQDFIKSGQKFDLVFIESLMYQCMYGLIHLVGSPPTIGLLSIGATFATYDSMGNPNNPSYMPDSLFPYSDHMSFWERANNMIFWCYAEYKSDKALKTSTEKIMRQYFGDEPPKVWEVEQNFSLIMLNNHWSASYPRPLLPNIIDLGGLHLHEKRNPLPKDLKEFLDGAKDGFIYFSLGSNVRSDKLPEHTRQQLLEAFAELPQRVLWKWEADTLPGQPENVRLGKWLPQQDILAHPNIRLFITQGGLQSFQEAIRNAVPLVGIPYVGDQEYNVKKIATAGVGLKLGIHSLNKDSLLAAVREVINNPSYRENMKKLSAINKDQPETPLERAVWWTEYVLRHNGAKHLRSAALHLAWWQYLLLDVIAFIALSLILALAVVYLIIRKLCCVLCRFFNSNCYVVTSYCHHPFLTTYNLARCA